MTLFGRFLLDAGLERSAVHRSGPVLSTLTYVKLMPSFILLYHRIGCVKSDPWALSVSPANFAEHLEVIRRIACPVSLTNLVQAFGEETQVPRAVITFDDGYADNLHEALPILERFEVPATFFVPSAAIGSPAEFWWDALERVLLQPGELPSHFPAGPPWPSISLEDAYTEAAAERYRSWRAWKDQPPTPRHQAFIELWKTCQVLTPAAQRSVIAGLEMWAGVTGDARGARRILTLSELQILNASPVATVSAHTRHHVRLSALPTTGQVDEILGSKQDLEEIGIASFYFSYPYGGVSDYTAETVALVKSGGFLGACVTGHEVVTAETDRHLLPRLFVEDCDRRTFERRVSELLG